jgi:hypothetical protein
LIAVDLRGVFVSMKHEIELMLRHGGGAIVDYAAAGVRINAICPGIIDAEMMQRFTGGTDEGRAAVIAQESIGRMGRPEEIAGRRPLALLRGGHTHRRARDGRRRPAIRVECPKLVEKRHSERRRAPPKPFRARVGTVADPNLPSGTASSRYGIQQPHRHAVHRVGLGVPDREFSRST